MDECSLYTDAELYDRLFQVSGAGAAVKDEARRLRMLASETFYVEEATRVAGAGGDVLEVACGTGRLTIPLARAGLKVTGLDLSGAMLRIAAEKAVRADLSIELLQADMRHFKLGRSYDAILIPGNSLLHLLEVEDLLLCLRNVREHLRPGGRLIFDISLPGLHALASGNVRAAAFAFEDPERGAVTVEEATSYDARAQVQRHVLYFSTEGSRDYRVIEYDLRTIFPQELLLLLEAAGLELETRYGDFGREAFTGESARQVCTCAAK